MTFMQLKKLCLSKGIDKTLVQNSVDRAELLKLLSNAAPTETLSPTSSLSKDELLQRVKQLERENHALREGELAPDHVVEQETAVNERPRGASLFGFLQAQTLQAFQGVQQGAAEVAKPMNFLQTTQPARPSGEGIEPVRDPFWHEDASVYDKTWIEELIALAEDESDTWQFIQQVDEVQMYQGGNERRHLIRGRCIVPAHPGEVWAFLTRVEETLSIVDKMAVNGTCQVLDHHDPHHKTVYCRFRMPPLITDRDMSWITVEKMMPDGTGIALARSVETPQAEHISGLVRADIDISGYVVRPYEGGTQAHVTYVLQIDPKFVLPTYAVSTVVKDQAMNVGRLREAFRSMGAVSEDSSAMSHVSRRISEDDFSV